MSRKSKYGAVVVFGVCAVAALGIVVAPRIDAYLLERAQRVDGQSHPMNTNKVDEEIDEFEPFADRVLADVRRAIEETGHNSVTSATAVQEVREENGVVTNGGSTEGSRDEVGTRQDISGLALLLLMREAVISYGDAGEYARADKRDLALSYLKEAEVLFQELLVLIDQVRPRVSEDAAQGLEHLRLSAQLYLETTLGAQRLVQGVSADLDLASTEQRARTELQRARELLERR
jgi:hypothetical protein